MRLIFYIIIFIPYISFSQNLLHNLDVAYKELSIYKRNSSDTEWKLYQKKKVENDSINKKVIFYTLKYHLFNDGFDTILIESKANVENKIIIEYSNIESKLRQKTINFYNKKQLTDSEFFLWSDSLNTWQSYGTSNYKYNFLKDSTIQVMIMTGMRINSTETKVYRKGKLTEYLYESVFKSNLKNGETDSIPSKNKTVYRYDAQGREIKVIKVYKSNRKVKNYTYKIRSNTEYIDSTKKVEFFNKKKFMKRWLTSRLDTTYYNKKDNETIIVSYTNLIKGNDKLYLTSKEIKKYDNQGRIIEEIRLSAYNERGNMISFIKKENEYKGLSLAEKKEYKY